MTNDRHCIGTHWTEQEIAVIDALAKRQDFSHVAVLRNALRNYQLAVEGTPNVGDLAAQDLRHDISRWALDSAARQGEVAVMFLNPLSRQNDKDDEFAVIYAKRAASAALFFLGRDNETERSR